MKSLSDVLEQKKTSPIMFYTQPFLKQLIHERAENQGLKISEYLRKLVLADIEQAEQTNQ